MGADTWSEKEPAVSHQENFVWVLVLVLAHAIVFYGCLQVVPKGVKCHSSFAHNVLWMMLLPFLLWYALDATYQLSGSVQDRWFGNNHSSWMFLRIYVSTQLFGSIVEMSGEGSLKKKLPLLLHHVVSIICYGGGITTGRLHFWAAFDGVCEATTMFSTILHFSKTKGGPVREWMERNLGSVLMLNGAILWLSYLIFRLALFPTWLCMFWSDMAGNPELGPKTSTFEKTVYPVTTILLLVMSSNWFLQGAKDDGYDKAQ